MLASSLGASISVDRMARTNSGIVTWDNYCHVYNSPGLSLTRDSSFLKSNFTVAAISQFAFGVRPSFLWTMVDPDVAVASVPQNVADLMAFKALVFLLVCFLSRFPELRND